MRGDDASVLDGLVIQRYGPVRLSPGEVETHLSNLARRRGWTLEKVEPSGLQSFESTRWTDRYGNPLGITLCRGSVVAVVPEGDEGAFVGPRTYQSDGPLFAALGADGLLILPEPEWLASPLTAGELVALLASKQGNGWEAYSVRYWKPASRGAALFNPWD